jgi:hypothetical protein
MAQDRRIEIPTQQEYSDMYWSAFDDGHYRVAMSIRETAEADHPGWQLLAESTIYA